MEESEIFIKLKTILLDQLHIEEEITKQSELLGQNILDSMEYLKFLTCVEETFNISISDEDLEKGQLGIIGNMCKYLTVKTK